LAQGEHAAAPAMLLKPGGHASDDVAPAAGTKRPAGLSQHDVAPAKSVNFPAGHAAQLPPLAPLPKRPAGHVFEHCGVALGFQLQLARVQCVLSEHSKHDAPEAHDGLQLWPLLPSASGPLPFWHLVVEVGYQ
jgi:hypothetical protein